ncbi:hypothetical protein BCR36DRAFT_585984 [Piromyces finnis]|uniref:AB hydrolase-1 domain-containing protein n=1 Tax=Piromyces finnis TaxID=1754191 RepID=A0A1Y1V248_9FUNG|nr:hypothetical protein BCR36DRAFT_585984 [Piromyces finnis]|eukprot:ORX44878.1 hypothetical protein BCR36DRAFT_585984 [Piromyces finnis]
MDTKPTDITLKIDLIQEKNKIKKEVDLTSDTIENDSKQQTSLKQETESIDKSSQEKSLKQEIEMIDSLKEYERNRKRESDITLEVDDSYINQDTLLPKDGIQIKVDDLSKQEEQDTKRNSLFNLKQFKYLKKEDGITLDVNDNSNQEKSLIKDDITIDIDEDLIEEEEEVAILKQEDEITLDGDDDDDDDDSKREIDITHILEENNPKKQKNNLKKDTLKKKKSKIREIIKIISSLIGIILSVYIFFNVTCYIFEDLKVQSYNYGTSMDVNGHNMVIDIVGESNEPSIVLLSDYNIPSPVIYYKPLTELLSKTYKVITIEPFGYGLSDIVNEERTIENIVTELHSCIEQLKLKDYYLMAHSLGGMYSLYYSNKYSNEVKGAIGFDTIVPKIEESMKTEVDSLYKTVNSDHIKNIIGYNRMASTLNNDYLIVPLMNPSNYTYTDDEKEMFTNIELNKGFNKSIRNEGRKIDYNLGMIHNMKYPKNMTLLNFISTERCDSLPNYQKLQTDVGDESISNEIIKITGKHKDFLFQHNDEIIKNLNKLIQEEN